MTAPALAENFFHRHRDKIAFAGPDECWPWTAGMTSSGYGAVWTGEKRRAHREAIEAILGEGAADGLVVRHSCDNPPCCNPAHLELGTHTDNVRDCVERGRHVAPKGEAHGRAKLTADDVRAIRSEYVRGSSEFGQTALAHRFGVHHTLIGLIIRRKSWAHI